MRRVHWLLLCCVFLLGCASYDKALKYVETCEADPACHAEMHKAGDTAHVVVESSSQGVNLPNIPEALAILASNIVSFGVGVYKGRKKRG